MQDGAVAYLSTRSAVAEPNSFGSCPVNRLFSVKSVPRKREILAFSSSTECNFEFGLTNIKFFQVMKIGHEFTQCSVQLIVIERKSSKQLQLGFQIRTNDVSALYKNATS
jgi:hypothetical protein